MAAPIKQQDQRSTGGEHSFRGSGSLTHRLLHQLMTAQAHVTTSTFLTRRRRAAGASRVNGSETQFSFG